MLENNTELLISNFWRVLNVVCFLLSNSLVSEFYMPTFQNTLSVPYFIPTCLWRWNREHWGCHILYFNQLLLQTEDKLKMEIRSLSKMLVPTSKVKALHVIWLSWHSWMWQPHFSNFTFLISSFNSGFIHSKISS